MTEAIATIEAPEPPTYSWSLLDVLLMTAPTVVLAAAALSSQAFLERLDAFAARGPGWLSSLVILLVAESLVLAGSVTLLGVLPRRLSWAKVGFRRAQWYWYLIGPVLAAVVLPVRLGMGLLVLLLLDPTMSQATNLAQVEFPETTWGGAIAIIFVGGVVVPFAEELFFRGVLYRWLRGRIGVWGGVLVSAALFGLAHIFLPTAVSAFVIGLVLAWVYERSESLWVPFVVHALNNTGVFTLVFLAVALLQFMEIPY